MSDPRTPQNNSRPRRSGLGLLLPLLLAGLLLYWIVNNNSGRADNYVRNQTQQILPFETNLGPGIARRVADFPYDRTEVHVFPVGATPPAAAGEVVVDPNRQLLEMSRRNEPVDPTGADDPPRQWPTRAVISANGGPLGCCRVGESELIIFYISTVDGDSALPTRSIGYRYPHMTTSQKALPLAVDSDVLPEVFVATPTGLLTSSDSTSEPAVEPAPPATPPSPTAPAPDSGAPPVPDLPQPSGEPAGTAPALPANPPSVENSSTPVSTQPAVSSADPKQSTTVNAPVIWAFGRSASGADDRRDRLCAIEIQGDSARLRTISNENVQITANSFLLTAVPMDNEVHLFWRVAPDNNLPARVINHAVYNGVDFQMLPSIQDAPTGFFTSTRFGDQILLTVLKPLDPATTSYVDRFRGKYVLQYALLDPTPAKAPGTAAPPVLAWTSAPGLEPFENLFDLTAVHRPDGRSTQLMLRGMPRGLDEIYLVTLPADSPLTTTWKQRPFLTSTPAMIPDADKIVVVLLIGMLGLFGGILLVAWLRPWRWLNRSSKP